MVFPSNFLPRRATIVILYEQIVLDLFLWSKMSGALHLSSIYSWVLSLFDQSIPSFFDVTNPMQQRFLFDFQRFLSTQKSFFALSPSEYERIQNEMLK